MTILVLTVLLTSLFFSLHLADQANENPDFSITPGSNWPNPTLQAEYSFPIYKSAIALKNDIDKARAEALPVFIYKSGAPDVAVSRLDGLINKLSDMEDTSDEEIVDAYSEDALLALAELTPEQKIDNLKIIRRVIKSLLKKAYKNGAADISIDEIPTTEIRVSLLPKSEKIIKKETIYDPERFAAEAKSIIPHKVPAITNILANEIAEKVYVPNIIFSAELTAKAKDIAESSVPKTLGIVRKGETIIARGERISDDNYLKIQSYNNTSFLKKDAAYTIWIYVGNIGHSLLILSILFIYLYKIRKRIYSDNVQVMILCGILVFTALLSWLSIEIPSNFPIEYLVIIPAFSMLSAIVFDSRTAFYVTVTMSLMLAGIRGNDYTTGVVMILTGTLAAYTVKDIQNRTQMFRSIFYIFLGFFVSIISFGLERSTEFSITLNKLLLALINASTAPLITFGLLFILERVSNIATDLRLQEYNNLNHPLLIKLSEKAPGTYQHTLAVAMLAERSASAIHANQLLAKVGAYFHDVGKLSNPALFAENENDESGSKHDNLSPRESAKAIKAHVNAGIEIAIKNKLPLKIVDFIPMHHGTTLIRHFYAKALENQDAESVDVNDFRYPGPRPNTKEAAIVMICDSAEAISRINKRTSVELDQIIKENIREKLLDGQFDKCNINLHELDKIRETLVTNLAGVAHKRVEYKKIPEG